MFDVIKIVNPVCHFKKCVNISTKRPCFNTSIKRKSLGNSDLKVMLVSGSPDPQTLEFCTSHPEAHLALQQTVSAPGSFVPFAQLWP